MGQIIEDTNSGFLYVVASASDGADTGSRGMIWKLNSTGAVSSFGVGGRVRINPGTPFVKCSIGTGLLVPGFSNSLYIAGWVSSSNGKFMWLVF
jgi:hypothetical protein